MEMEWSEYGSVVFVNRVMAAFNFPQVRFLKAQYWQNMLSQVSVNLSKENDFV